MSDQRLDSGKASLLLRIPRSIAFRTRHKYTQLSKRLTHLRRKTTWKNATRRWRELRSRPYFARMKGQYRGHRGFVVGNGPSLRMSDLDLLREEVCIASNKIYLAFRETQWRPTFYTVADPLLWEKIRGELHRYISDVNAPSYLSTRRCRSKVYSWPFLGSVEHHKGSGLPISSCAMRGFFGGRTVTFENLQFAMYLGLDPIYLIGCDHNYVEPKFADPSQKILAGSAQNHFIAEYRSPDEVVNPAPIELMDQAYAVARQYADRVGAAIRNATRGGKLEVFERADFASLFS